MANASSGGLSNRGWANVERIMPKIAAAVSERVNVENHSIDLATAENWLLRTELTEICKEAINTQLEPADLSYPRAFQGYPTVLKALVTFLNRYFAPHVTVEESHIATAPGAASCIDTLLYNICDPGDGILVPSPYWSGFDFQFKARSAAVPIAVPVTPLRNTVSLAIIPALEKAFKSSTVPIKGLMLCNPQNPLGLCYPREVIEECMRFCQRKDIHYISDEVYALTSFPAHDLPEPVPFVSALSINLANLGVEGSRVHTVWSSSKDLGQSGVRMGCSITQFNQEMQVGLALASNTQTSSLTSIFVAALLNSPRLPDLLAVNSQRLASNYDMLTAVLKRHSIEYIPCNAGLYLYAKVVRNKETSDIAWEDESAAIAKAKVAGVLLSGGKAYHGHEDHKGWARIGFAVDPEVMAEACTRLDKAFS